MAVTINASTSAGAVTTADTSGILQLQSNGTTALTVSGSTVQATTTIGVGGATPSASGAGITFPATQSASSNANTLDDYEEGTFSPTLLTGGTNFTSVTYHPDNAAAYVKIGNCVYVTGVIRTSSITVGSASGNLFIGGLPFSASATYLGGGFSGTQASGWTTYNPAAAQVTPSGTTAGLFYWSTANGSSTNMPFGNANTALGNNFAFFGYYFV
jgi:hypothetical protein